MKNNRTFNIQTLTYLAFVFTKAVFGNCVLMVYCGLNNNTFKLFIKDDILYWNCVSLITLVWGQKNKEEQTLKEMSSLHLSKSDWELYEEYVGGAIPRSLNLVVKSCICIIFFSLQWTFLPLTLLHIFNTNCVWLQVVYKCSFLMHPALNGNTSMR